MSPQGCAASWYGVTIMFPRTQLLSCSYETMRTADKSGVSELTLLDGSVDQKTNVVTCVGSRECFSATELDQGGI